MALFVSRSTRVADTAGPSTPTITTGTATSSTITITRTVDSTDASGVAYYETQRAAAGSGSWTAFDSSNTNPLTAAGLNPGTAYDFRQRAVDVFGNVGSFSSTSTSTTQSDSWADVIVGFSQMPAQLSVAGRKVGMDLTGSDFGSHADIVNGASVTQVSGGAFDGSMAVRIRPPAGSTPNPNATYSCIMFGLDVSNGGLNDVAQGNLGFCVFYGPRYWDLAATDKLTGFEASQALGGEPQATGRAAIFDNIDAGFRLWPITATTLQSYYNPASGIFPASGPDADYLMKGSSTINHANNPPLVGSEWLYFEQEVDYRQNRGNPFGRNRLDVWARDGYIGFLEIPLNWLSSWDFSYRYLRQIEYIGALWNNPSTAHVDNYLMISHPVFSANRSKDQRMGPPPGFLL